MRLRNNMFPFQSSVHWVQVPMSNLAVKSNLPKREAEPSTYQKLLAKLKMQSDCHMGRQTIMHTNRQVTGLTDGQKTT